MSPRLSLLALSLFTLPIHAADLSTAIDAFKAERFGEAKQAFEAAKDQPEARLYLARIAEHQGRRDEALDTFEALAKTEGKNPELHFFWGVSLCNEAQSASMFSALGHAKNCVKHFKKALELQPDNLDYRKALFDYYVGAPGIAGGGADKAHELIAAVKPVDEVLATVMEARVAGKEEKFPEAEALMKSAIEKAPENSDYRLLLGTIYQQAERYEDAFAYFKQWQEAQPDNPKAWYQQGRNSVLGKVHLTEGEQALLHYLSKPAAAEEPSHAWARLRLAQIYQLMGKKADSAQQAELALAGAQGDERLIEQAEELKG
ncbi:MAG: tetratricopeptide repeat protein [Gammaproteobacteria bacterium]|nr:tetratricopeptide repeat protein [Gammaproteobacteria bacterium]